MDKPSIIKTFNLKKEMLSKQQLKLLITTSPLCNENFYMLLVSIFMTCLGLSLPSKTMLIGGMVISPFLGSLLSLAYGLGIHDSTISYRAVWNYILGVIFSTLLAILYFAIVPDFPPHQDLLNMVKLSYEDFLVSIIGGFTITFSIFYNSPTMPFVGTSIATTLTPPVCIIGYGISQAHPSLAWSACRMFVMNSLLIFAACYILFFIFARDKNNAS